MDTVQPENTLMQMKRILSDKTYEKREILYFYF